MFLSARCDARSAASEPVFTPDQVRGGLSPEHSLGGADLGKEIVNLTAQLLGSLAERLGGGLDVLRGGAGRVGAVHTPMLRCH